MADTHPSSGRPVDYRMSLVAERTYLAYLRTGLALTAAGVAVAAALPNAGAIDLRRVIGVCLVVLGAAIFVVARTRWTAVVRAMERGQPLPRARHLAALTWALLLVAVGAAVVAVLV